MHDTYLYAAIGAIVFIFLFSLFFSFFSVDQQTVAIVERFGKFKRSALAGLNIKVPFIDFVRGRISLRIQQLDIPVETKTKDNVFTKIAVSVQFKVVENKIYDAFYKLTNPEMQITSFIFDVVRAQVPKMSLDDVFERKNDIADAVCEELTELMTDFGYVIVKALVTDIDPDIKVKAAMNEINEQQRLRLAATEKGEAQKILTIKQAEAEAISLKLQGEGISAQRQAIINGLKKSVDDFRQAIPEASASDVMNMVLTTLYYDTLKDVAHEGTNTILLPQQPTHGSLADSMRDAVITGHLATNKTVKC